MLIICTFDVYVMTFLESFPDESPILALWIKATMTNMDISNQHCTIISLQ